MNDHTAEVREHPTRLQPGVDVLPKDSVVDSLLQMRLYVIVWKGAATLGQIRGGLTEHLAYVNQLEANGVLFASGPLTTAPEAPAGDGLTIVRAENVRAARQIALADPFVIADLRTFEVREWTVMEGSFTMTVRLSTQSVQFT